MNYFTKEMFEFIESQDVIPADVCTLAREFLTEYDCVYLVRDNKEWRASTGIGIQRHYAPDHLKITLLAKDFR